MGQSDLQFKAYLRLLLDDIHDVLNMVTDLAPKQKLEKMAAFLQASIEE